MAIPPSMAALATTKHKTGGSRISDLKGPDMGQTKSWPSIYGRSHFAVEEKQTLGYSMGQKIDALVGVFITRFSRGRESAVKVS